MSLIFLSFALITSFYYITRLITFHIYQKNNNFYRKISQNSRQKNFLFIFLAVLSSFLSKDFLYFYIIFHDLFF